MFKIDPNLVNVFLNDQCVIEHIEIQFRTQVAYVLATKYGSLGYLNEDNFCSCTRNKNTSDHSMIINELNKEISRNKNTPFVAHHLDNYEGQFPIWIAVELFSFGRLSKLFSIMKDDDKKEVSNFYEKNGSS